VVVNQGSQRILLCYQQTAGDLLTAAQDGKTENTGVTAKETGDETNLTGDAVETETITAEFEEDTELQIPTTTTVAEIVSGRIKLSLWLLIKVYKGYYFVICIRWETNSLLRTAKLRTLGSLQKILELRLSTRRRRGRSQMQLRALARNRRIR